MESNNKFKYSLTTPKCNTPDQKFRSNSSKFSNQNSPNSPNSTNNIKKANVNTKNNPQKTP